MKQSPWRSTPKKPYKERDPKVTSAMMAAVKGKNNKAELALRKELWSRGLRYRLYDSSLIGKPDLVFKGPRVVIFVDGDFWHGRALVEEGVEGLKRGLRTQRSDWWIQKIGRNVDRDRKVTRRLRRAGWRVMRFWESEVQKDLFKVADKVERTLRKATSERSSSDQAKGKSE
jgi:DNA mismatch endonuclease (patch repair protein)